jgi:hypothetical protein
MCPGMVLTGAAGVAVVSIDDARRSVKVGMQQNGLGELQTGT